MSAHRTDYTDLIRETPTDFSVHSRVYTDPAIFAAEMHNLFENGWCYVAHESEIEKPGDFRTSAIGRIPVIVSRGDDNQVYVNMNACRHRGTLVCREERGNTRYFTCPYHGWSYHKDGKLNHITDRDNFPDGWGEDITGLIAAERVAVYRGMIFASFNKDVPEIEQYLGPLKIYVDYWFDHALNGTVKVLKPWRATYQGNWKYQLENSTDGWHARYVHISALKTISHYGTYASNTGWSGCTRGFDGGHGILERPRTDIPPDLQPVSVDRTIVYEFPVELEGTDAVFNKAIRTRLLKEISISSGSPVSGMVNADDVEIYARNQSGLASGQMEWIRLARGIHREVEERKHEWSGQDMDELPQRAIYREWARRMK